MNIPFTTDQFFEVFAQYNVRVWPMQFVLNLLALAALGLLFRVQPSSSRIITVVLSVLWAWMAIAYHFLFFTSINPVAWAFGALFLAGAFWFAWIGEVREHLRFRFRGGWRGVVGVSLVVFALLIYPLIGHLLGHRYPAIPTFGLPCPTTIFTLGMLVFARTPVPKSVFVVPLVWALIGSVAAFKLGVYQDLGLLVAGLLGGTVVAMPSTRTS